MLAHRHVFTLWLLLLLHDSESAMRFDLFRRGRERDPGPQEGEVRLFGGGVSEGRVEIYHSDTWGTVCDDGWDLHEAQVVCRQLHFPGAKSVVTGKDYGKASGPIWLDDMECKGTEDYLSTCAFKSWGATDCSHKEDVGVICETSGSNMTKIDSTYSLDHSISLSDERGQIFDSGRGCDFQIFVQTATGNRQEDETTVVVETTTCAHKMILSQFPLFNASEGINNITVDISQSCEPFFTSFIRYIYTRKIDVTSSSAQCLHWMAYTFGVKQLMEDTGRLFSEILPEDTLFHTQVSLYKYAEETGDMVLQETCLQYLAWNFQNLTMSPAWTHLSVELLGSLLMRSDLVVPDEYFVLQTVESWITERGNSASLETQLNLLSRVRFPMIPTEVLYDLESNSSLYSTHKNMYHEKIFKAFQFNVLLFSKLMSNPKFNREDDDYRPRIYTAEPWSVAISQYQTPYRNQYNQYGQYNQYNQGATRQLNTPIHNSMIFKSNQISWQANVFMNQYECSNRGLRCESFPAARLAAQSRPSELSNILFRNQLLLMCQGKYICQVQDFKDDMATNGTQAAYPCPDDQYTYHFVVRPEYV
ncbi:galectin-3-binding protein A-like isoform X2 [Sebastes umbrosus]|uniref:galectin-3-binding protein A-like isoform X2 n=1 Tax=Sebastes umbrosus TaxID=72105 RepID=UPI00189D6841|nr:galectin-3-binding protein A-like isoform X2 [Sebastes umbrosus]